MRKFFFILFIFLFLGNILYVLVAISLNKWSEKNNLAATSLVQNAEKPPPESSKEPAPQYQEEVEVAGPNYSEIEAPLAVISAPPIDWNIHNSYNDIVQKMSSNTDSIIPNDTFYNLQYYLDALNVPEAWNKVNKNNKVVVAVIDDGININHPDLTNNIWIETWSSYGSNKIKNFVWDEIPDNLPTGKHGTMVAGIIWATSNNGLWIAGIAKNVEIMPLRVFDFQWNAKTSSILNAIYYAINKKANIINLSLGQTQFAYTREYDDIMRLAYENGVVVIIASGNGDVLSKRNSWINTTVNPLSPVCNNSWSKKYSIGVGSLTQSGDPARWSNYGSCVSVFAPGENIFSTSIAVFNKEYGVDYDTDSGTSFSAPMVTGIVALWFNQFGYVSPDIVYETLKESLVLNSKGVYTLNAEKYIEVLSSKESIIREKQALFSLSKKHDNNTSFLGNNLSHLSDQEYLVKKGYIDKSNYDLDKPLLRKEALAFSMKFSHQYAPNSSCSWVFIDVPKSNTWICGIVELALEQWVITRDRGKYFEPDRNISLVEAVSMLLRASHIKIQQYSGGEFEPWQTNVIGTTFSLWLVDHTFDFPTSKVATRKDLFAIARRIIELKR